MIFNMVGGGGSGSEIVVTAPTGSTVTCSMNGVVKTAEGRQSRNLLDCANISSQTVSGVTAFYTRYGIQLKGTIGSGVSAALFRQNPIQLPPGTYTMCGVNSNKGFLAMAIIKNGSTRYIDALQSATFTLDVTESSVTWYVACASSPVDAVFYPMIVSGSEALPFEPYYDGAYWTFKNCGMGVWRVTAALNGKTVSKNVVVPVDAALLYDIALFDYGNQEYAWQQRTVNFGYGNTGGTATVETQANGSKTLKIDTPSTKQTGAVYETVSDIDLTGISTLRVKWTSYFTRGSNMPLQRIALVVYKRSTSDPYTNAAAKAEVDTAHDKREVYKAETLTLDVSALNGSYAVAVGVGCSVNINGNYITQINIEKLEALA